MTRQNGEQIFRNAGKAHRQKHQICGKDFFRAFHRREAFRLAKRREAPGYPADAHAGNTAFRAFEAERLNIPEAGTTPLLTWGGTQVQPSS